MSVARTAEIRWFLRGSLPDGLLEWFRAGESPERERRRVDRYLLLPRCTTTSVKIRQGRLEVKRAKTGPRLAVIDPAASGWSGEWTKWSHALGTGIRSQPWIPVAKTRHVCHRLGCDVELTAIELLGQAWHSLGFEAHSPTGSCSATLERTLREFFARHGSLPVSLRRSDSMSYAQWLVCPAVFRIAWLPTGPAPRRRRPRARGSPRPESHG